VTRSSDPGNAKSGGDDDGDKVGLNGDIHVLYVESVGSRTIALPLGANEVSARLRQLLTNTEEGRVKKAAVADHQRYIAVGEFRSCFAGADLRRHFGPAVHIDYHNRKAAAVGTGNGTGCGDVLIDQKQRNILADAELTPPNLEAKTDAFLLMDRRKT
jgi:hypothetical protein